MRVDPIVSERLSVSLLCVMLKPDELKHQGIFYLLNHTTFLWETLGNAAIAKSQFIITALQDEATVGT